MRKLTFLDTLQRDLVVCPKCFLEEKQSSGNRHVFLGETLPDGSFCVERKRIKKSKDGTSLGQKQFIRKKTVIRGNDFSVYCGDCGEMVYSKKGGVDANGTVSYSRVAWFHRKTYVLPFGTTGI